MAHKKAKSVTGGKIWTNIDFALIWKRYHLMAFFFYVGIAALIAVIVHNFPRSSSTESYYFWVKPAILQSNTSSFWISVTLLSIGVLFAFLAIMILVLTPDPNAGSRIKYKSGDVYCMILAVALLLMTLLGVTMVGEMGRPAAAWINKTYDVTVADWTHIPPVRDGKQIEILGTDKDGDMVSLTLDFKNDKLYVVNQEKVSGK